MKNFVSFVGINRSIFVSLLFLFLLQIPLILPLFRSGYFPNHDDVQVVRVFEIFQSIKFGDFPPRWSAGLLYGHGYPVFIFYAPFVYLVAALFVLLGATFLTAVKLAFIFSFFLGAIGMFFLVREYWGEWAGVLASSMYSFFPYRSVDMYVRGNIAEFFAYQFFPLIVLGNVKLYRSEKKLLWSLVFGVLLALLIISHNVSAFIYAQFLFLFNLYILFAELKKSERFLFLKYLSLSGLLALFISCFFWLPLLIETHFVRVGEFSEYPYYQYFITLSQFWDSPWGYGGFILENPMSLQFGKVALLITAIVAGLSVYLKTKFQKLIYFMLGILIIFTLLETRMTEIVWHVFSSILSYMQFPWRYHILTTFTAAFLAGSFVFLIGELGKKFGKQNRVLIPILCFIIIGLLSWENIRFFKPEKYTNLPSVSETTTWNDEYLPNWVKAKPKDYAADKVHFLSGSGVISHIDWGYLEKKFNYESTSSGVVEIAHIYYPGWNAYVDGTKQEISYDNDYGLMRLKTRLGSHLVDFRFERTWWRLLSEIVSLVGIGALLVLLFFATKKELVFVFLRQRRKNGKKNMD